MDRERYKKVRQQPALKKRSINGEETYNLRHHPSVSVPNKNEIVAEPETAHVPKPALKAVTPTKPIVSQQPPKQLVVAQAVAQSTNNTTEPELPALFDEDDEDLFGVWKTQKDIKKARQEKEAKEKAEKLATKMLKKEQKKAQKQGSSPTKKHNIFAIGSGKKKYLLVGAALVLVPVLVFAGNKIVHNNDPKNTPKTDVLGQTDTAVKPEFDILKPTTTDNQATNAKYDKTKKVASYNDVLADVPITVSQQPLPSAFIADPTGQVEKLAKQINANDKISTSDTTAYAGISIKGPQTVVFTKNDLLIFIIANKKIDAVDWTKYIEKMI